MEQIEGENRFQEWANQLHELEMETSDGRGVECVHWIVEDLKKGDVEAAKANYRNQSDKISAYPAIKAFLKEIGIVEEIDWSKYKDGA